MVILSVIDGDGAKTDDRLRLDFGRGRSLRHVFGNTFEWVGLNGSHERYQCALAITYEPTLYGQYCKSLRAR